MPHIVIPLNHQHAVDLDRLRNRNLPRDEFRDGVASIGCALMHQLLRDELVDEGSLYAVIVMRAGIGLALGALGIVDCDVGFINVKRDHITLAPTLGMYECAPDLGRKTVIVFETMLATGGSAGAAIDAIKSKPEKKPDHIILFTLISAPEGIAYIETHHPDVTIVTAVIDDGLDQNGYIVPGLGDAGDRLFGPIE